VFTLNSSLYSKLPYDPVKDFVPVQKLVTANLMLVTRPDFPATSVKEFIEYAKKNPGKLTYGSVGAGGVNHLAMSWFNNLNGLTMEHVPYKGLVQALQDIVTGRVDGMFAVIGGALPFVQSGKLKVLGVSKATRVPLLPDVPTIAEQGVAGFESGTWQGLLVPAGTPGDVVARLSAELTRIIRSPEIRSRLTAQGAEVYTMSPAEFSTFFDREQKRWAAVVASGGVKLD